MVKKIISVFILCILISMCFLQVKALEATSWEDLTIADIDEAIRTCIEDGRSQDISNIYMVYIGAEDINAADFDTYEKAQHYVEIASYLLEKLEEDETGTLRGAIGNVGVGEDQYWVRIENNIAIASQVEKPSTGGGDNNGGSGTGGTSTEEKAWNDYTIEDYRGNGEKGLPEMWEIIKNVPVANLTKEEKVYYIQCLDAINQNKQNVDYNFSAEVSSEIDNLYDKVWDTYKEELEGTAAEKIIVGDKPIYENPLINYSGTVAAQNVTPDDIISDADTFLQDGQNSDIATINQDNADTALKSIYNILLAIGITVTVVWGLIIAIKLMMSSVEEKAEYKKMLWPYLVGCIVIFGSFAIWKIVIVAMNNVL